ncbi:MAG: PAS domain-containing protein, partial [Smithellaceae bacterium]|nr:PAS domain-containing protein [Smithellaceae bacterium]
MNGEQRTIDRIAGEASPALVDLLRQLAWDFTGGVGDAVVIVDAEGRITYSTKKSIVRDGNSLEITGRTLWEFGRDLAGEELRGLCERLRTSLDTFAVEYPLPDSEMWYESRFSTTEDGRDVAIRFNEISERRRALRDLAKSEEKFSALYTSMIEGVALHELVYDDAGTPIDYIITDANPAYEQITGISPERVAGSRASEVYGTGLPPYIDIYAKVAATGKPALFETYFPPMDKYFNISVFSMASGQFTTVFQDITTRKKNEELLRQSEALYRAAGDSFNFGVWIAEPDGKSRFASDSCLELLDMTQDEFRQFGWAKRMYPEEVVQIQELWRKCALTGEDWSAEIRLQTRDGSERTVLSQGRPVWGKDGRISCWAGVNFDITGLKRAERELSLARDELEKRVEERTAELQKVNEDLAAEISHRARTEAVLEQERKRFYDVLEQLPAYVILLTPDYHVPFSNRFFRERFGEDEGRCCYDFLFGRSEPCEICETYTVLKTKASHEWEWTGPDGRNYHIYDFPFNDTDGSTMILEMGIDVTEQKKAEETLRSVSSYVRGLLEASLDPLVTISPEGKITDVNRATELATGLDRDALVGSDFSHYFTDPERARAGYRHVLAEGLVRDYPLTIRHCRGSETDVLYNATVYKNEAGRIEGVFAAARDVTEQKAAERKQAVTNALLELFLVKTSRKAYLDETVQVIGTWSGCEAVGIRIRDEEGNIPYEAHIGFDEKFLALENALTLEKDKCICIRTILEKPQKQERSFVTAAGSFYCNDSQGFLAGLTEKQIKEYRGNCMRHGFQSLAVVPIRYRDQVLGAIHLADFQQDLVPLEKVLFVEQTVAPMIGEAVYRIDAEQELEKHRLYLEELVEQRTGELEKLNRELLAEISRRKKISDELSMSNQDLEQFAYVASHDLQEPLRAISGFVELLKRRLGGTLDEKNAQYVTFVVDGVARMQTLINGLLEYSRLDSADRTSRLTDARATLERVLADLRPTMEKEGASVTVGPLPMVRINSVQLEQLFRNLLGNALKFRDEAPPEISISAVRQDDAWLFSICDNGIGIDPQYVQRIFLIFQRLHTR